MALASASVPDMSVSRARMAAQFASMTKPSLALVVPLNVIVAAFSIQSVSLFDTSIMMVAVTRPFPLPRHELS
jgi:hypothetical protein